MISLNSKIKQNKIKMKINYKITYIKMQLRANFQTIKWFNLPDLMRKEKVHPYFSKINSRNFRMIILIKKETLSNCSSQFNKRMKRFWVIELSKKIIINSLMVLMKKTLSKQADIILFRAATQKMDFEK
jgi:hypothetical protein